MLSLKIYQVTLNIKEKREDFIYLLINSNSDVPLVSGRLGKGDKLIEFAF